MYSSAARLDNLFPTVDFLGLELEISSVEVFRSNMDRTICLTLLFIPYQHKRFE